MKASFWHACWEKNSLGFHQSSFHPFLEQYLKPLLEESHQQVFVPLCGKSDDMIWLAEHMEVTGAELSDIACRDFFLDKGLTVRPKPEGAFNHYQHENISLWQGDFFQLAANKFTRFDWVYDRAALIALPESMQQDYVQHLASFIDENTKLFLISLEFPQEELEGPPFALASSEIQRLFSDFKVERIAEHDLEDKVFAQRQFNVSYLKEALYLIRRK